MEIYDVEPLLLLPAVLDLRPLVRELLVARSYPQSLAEVGMTTACASFRNAEVGEPV